MNVFVNVLLNVSVHAYVYVYVHVYRQECQDLKDGERSQRRQSQEKTSWSSDIDVQIVRCALEKAAKDKPNQQLRPSAVSLRRAGVEQLYQIKRMNGGIVSLFLLIFSRTCTRSGTCRSHFLLVLS